MLYTLKSLYKFSFSFLLLLSFAVNANVNDYNVPKIWQMLDYMATDYAGAVGPDGVIIHEAEYAEMAEFSKSAAQQISQLSENNQKAQLIDQAQQLVALIDGKAAPLVMSKQAHKVADLLIELYPIPTAPTKNPDLAEGATLYQAHCAMCHGATGHADGPLSASLEPPAIAFADKERADQRSPLSLYQTLSQGVAGTSMASFEKVLTEDQRWSVAYYAGSLAYQNDVKQGKTVWQDNQLARAQISNLDELSRTRVDQIASALGLSEAQQLIAYLRSHPEALNESLTGIDLARGRLTASVNAYKSGDVKNAVALALSSYLDGVEPIEPILNANNNALRVQIELGMGVYRTGLNKGVSISDAEQQAAKVDALLKEAKNYTGSDARSSATTFLGAFTILLREGLEAILVVVAIFAFLTKSNRQEMVSYVHFGWISALVLGVLTWFVARYFIEISGANRELTEGISALFAAVMLLSIGLWMHQKSMGDRWQEYIKQKMGHALNKKSAWLLFVLAFVTVYREAFETILFYIALWTDEQAVAFLAGIACGVVSLAVVAWLLLRTSKKLPIGTFFSASSALIAVLVVVLAGKGISALQEAGWVGVDLISMPHVEMLGMYPTLQTSLAQLAAIILLALGAAYNYFSSKAVVNK